MATAVFGRDSELVVVAALLASARHGRATLVLEGDPGIGKTTVWREGLMLAAGQGYRVLSCRTAPAEVRLSFTALCDLLAPIAPADFDSLPNPQRRALDAALLRIDSGGTAPNRRAIGTGIVSLLTNLSAVSPVLLAIDDLQWLDLPSASALEFALRRLTRHPITVLATVRLGERATGDGLLSAGVDEVRSLRLGPLNLRALYEVVSDRLGRGLPRPLLIRIEKAAAGNPFYALEIARALESDGRGGSGQALPIPDDLRELVARRLARLPRPTREALLKVSALAQPTIALVDPSDLEAAEEVGVARVHDDGRIEFVHPLFAGAIYAAASQGRRRRLHGELAKITSDIEERARHLILSHTGDATDADLADVLHGAAEHALRRGAPEVAAEFDEQSARRTPLQRMELRWHRCLRATRNYLKAGDPLRSRALCEAVLAMEPTAPVRARAMHLLAEISAAERMDDAIPLLEQALECVGDDIVHAAQLEIALGCMFAADLELECAHTHLIRSVALAERSSDAALIAEAVALKACAALLCGHGVDNSVLERALALEDPDHEVGFQMRPSLNVAIAYEFTGQIDRARRLFVKLKEQLVARGDESDLPQVLAHLAATSFLAGNLALAEQEANDAERLAALTGVEVFRALALTIRAYVRSLRGNADAARADGDEALDISQRMGWPHGINQSRWALASIADAEGDPAAALATLDPVVVDIETLGVYEWPIAMALPDAIEALIATGGLERATRLTNALADFGRKFDRSWALATSGRCRALLEAAVGALDRAAAAAEAAVIEHARLPMPIELGRTLLVQGQLQRRRGERRAARKTLHEALEIFEHVGTPHWADRAAAEIARIGVRRAPDQLTRGEERVAGLAAQGLTNPEIAARLFVSRRTVEANLSRTYRKLDIRSRAELGVTMAKRQTEDPR